MSRAMSIVSSVTRTTDRQLEAPRVLRFDNLHTGESSRSNTSWAALRKAALGMRAGGVGHYSGVHSG